jgi:type IV pilus assembly protein PilX
MTLIDSRIKYTCRGALRQQAGVVLIIALIMLVVLSMVAVAAVKSTLSTEVSTNNSRTYSLAMQAAEAALRHCETLAQNSMKSPVVVPNQVPEAAPASGVAYFWEDVANNWDATGFTTHNGVVSSSTDINDSSTQGLYKRFPECMIQYVQSGNTQKFIVTARGFGPDVPALAGTTPAKPIGTEVWLQSTNTYIP